MHYGGLSAQNTSAIRLRAVPALSITEQFVPFVGFLSKLYLANWAVALFMCTIWFHWLPLEANITLIQSLTSDLFAQTAMQCFIVKIHLSPLRGYRSIFHGSPMPNKRFEADRRKRSLRYPWALPSVAAQARR